MPATAALRAHLYQTPDLASVECCSLGWGEVAVFALAAPDRPDASEDAAALIPVGGDRCVLVVADGMGGARAGAIASRMAVDSICESLRRADPTAPSLRGPILDGIELAGQRIRSLGLGAATTLCVAEVDREFVRPYHIGDSAILLVGQRGKHKLRTTPHSPVGFGVEAGLIDAGEALHHDDLHLISNALGAEGMRIEVGSPRVMARRDTLLLATDGLTDNLALDEIVEIVRCGPLKEAVETLGATARGRMEIGKGPTPSKPDDLTIVALRRTR